MQFHDGAAWLFRVSCTPGRVEGIELMRLGVTRNNSEEAGLPIRAQDEDGLIELRFEVQ